MKSRLLKSIAGVGIALLVLTGCADVHVDVNVKDNKTADLSLSFEMDKRFLEKTNQTSEQYLEQLESAAEDTFPEGTKIDTVNNNEKIGIKVNSSSSYEEEDTALNIIGGSSSGITLSGETVSVVFPIDKLLAPYNLVDPQTFQQTFTAFEVSVTLPGKIEDVSLGGKIEDNKVTWGSEEIYQAVQTRQPLTVTGSAVSNFPFLPWLITGLVLGLVFLAVGLTIRFIRKLNDDKDALPVASGFDDDEISSWKNEPQVDTKTNPYILGEPTVEQKTIPFPPKP